MITTLFARWLLGKSAWSGEWGCALAICQLQLRELAKTDVPDKQLPATAENCEKWATRMSLHRYRVVRMGRWRRIWATVWVIIEAVFWGSRTPVSHYFLFFLADISCNWKLNYEHDERLVRKSRHFVRLSVSDLIHQTEIITIERPRIPDCSILLIRKPSNSLSLTWIFN